MRTKENKIEKYTIFIMPSTLHNISGLDCDASLEEVREFAKKQNGRVAHRVFNSERDCLVYFTALCDSGNIFGENLYYYLFTEPTVEPIDEPILTWFNLFKEYLPESKTGYLNLVMCGLRYIRDEDCSDFLSKDDEEALVEFFHEDLKGKESKLGPISGVVYYLEDLFKTAFHNYLLDEYVGYIDPKDLHENPLYYDFMKEKRNYPELRDK